MPDQEPRSSLIQLSPRQQTAVAAALTVLAAAVILAALLSSAWLVAAFLRRFSRVLLPLVVGAVAALVFRPYFAWLRTRLRWPTALALGAVFASILIPLVAFVWFFGALLVGQLTELAAKLPDWWVHVAALIKERWPRVLDFLQNDPWGQRLRSVLDGQRTEVLQGLQAVGGKAFTAGAWLFRTVTALVAWAVVPVYFTFFLIAEPLRLGSVEHQLPFLKPGTRADVLYLVREFVNIVVAFFRGQLIISFLQGLLYAIGFSLAGLKYGFVFGLLLGLLNVIPYLGSMLGLGAGIPLAYFQPGGGITLVIWVLVVFCVVQIVEGYVLTPRIMGGRTGLHPLAIIVAILFWGSALEGVFGMILAIPLTAFLAVFWRLAREKYIGELL